ncbi:protein set domain group 40 [Phtheirospermum japonicum]|uniref:Protein set domain group 40 n=1 Tax=Phtheirospermum japonicum TaxID=374723 RepID=A0A830CYZ7_9LAMI|nr:protein set domain group 40 [Phtheirospermum japonicum]
MEESANLESFLQWAAGLGISDSPVSHSPSHSCLGHSLTVSHFPQAGGRGLAAARFLRKGDLVLRVPKAALMTSACLTGNDHKLSAALGKYPLFSSTQIFSIALLNEVNKGRSSWWYPYLKQLPRSYDLLASFSRFEIEALQIDDAIWTAEKAVLKDKAEWEEATPLMCEVNLKPQLRTFIAWLWASATISSRSMHIPWDTAGCLCPVGDYFNYTPLEENPYHLKTAEVCGDGSFSHIASSFERESTDNSTEDPSDDANMDRLIDAGYNEAVACYCFYAKRYYCKGEQVLLSYGTYTNLELLEHYGFILEQNPNDKAYIPMETEMYSLCSWPKDSLYISQDGNPSFALLSTVRLWATPANMRRSVKHVAFSGQRISDENEVAVMKWIAMKCRVLLSSCSTSIDEDALLLNMIDKIEDYTGEEGPPGSCDEIRTFLEGNRIMSGKTRRSVCRWKLAVQWRHTHKKILSDCISYCTKVLDNVVDDIIQ